MAHKVLVLDDDESILHMMNEFFSAHFFNVDIARQISEAKELLANSTYSVAILDLALSDIDHTDGLDMVTYVRKNSPKTKIIVYTCNDNLEVKKLAMRLGADLYLVKPVPLQQLGKEVFKLCGEKTGKT